MERWEMELGEKWHEGPQQSTCQTVRLPKWRHYSSMWQAESHTLPPSHFVPFHFPHLFRACSQTCCEIIKERNGSVKLGSPQIREATGDNDLRKVEWKIVVWWSRQGSTVLRYGQATPKHQTYIGQMFNLYSTDIDKFLKNLMSSKSFPKLLHFSISISFPPQFVQMDTIEGCVAIGHCSSNWILSKEL